jgi:hypothetical protein
MLHSRPGFAPRHSDKVPAKLNADMVPAINRKSPENTSPLHQAAEEHHLDARTQAAMAKLAQQHPPKDLLTNPAPSEPPKILTPGK